MSTLGTGEVFNKLGTIIVDDESLSRQRISSFLEAEADFHVLGSCSLGEEAIRVVDRYRPDLIFLDVQLPDIDGFQLLEALESESAWKPMVVFVTAYDQFASRAFEIDAVDYLLKPFTQERFQATLQRAREQHLRTKSSDVAMTPQHNSPGDYIQRLVFRSQGKIIFLKIHEVRAITAEGNYLRIYSGNKSYLLRNTMAAMEPRLNPEMFVRTHRSTIVNLRHVKEMQVGSEDGAHVLMEDGTKHTLSRSHLARISELLTQ